MRTTHLAAIAVCALLTSCKFPLKLTTIQTDTQPHVTLKNGKKLEGSDPEYKDRAFAADKIKIGDTTVKAKDVVFYSSNGINYANVSKRKTTFASQVAAGKINVYKYESTYTSYSAPTPGYGGRGHYSTKHSVNYYVQKKYGSPVLSLSYKNLRPMLQKNTPEFKMLENYRKTRIVSRSLGYGALACLASGIALANSDNTKTSDIGLALTGTAFGLFWGWVDVYVPNKMKIYKAMVLTDDLQNEHTRRRRRGRD